LKYTIPYGKQHITQEDEAAIIKALHHDYLTQGPMVKEFEENFSNFVGSKYASAVSNGTAALHLCAMALGVNKHSHVITSPITFSASANCVRYCGGTVHFVDIDEKSATLDINKVEDYIKANPNIKFSGIIPVDFAGYAVNLEDFRSLADKHNLWIIEDACHAPGASFKNSNGKLNMAGNGAYADLSIFSFHPVKHIACGEGGMITTSNEALKEKVDKLRTHGISKNVNELQENHGGWYMELQELGYNYRMPDLLCALGNSQLKSINSNLENRRKIAKTYNDAFVDMHISLPSNKLIEAHAFHLYVIQTEFRKALYDDLRKLGIYAQVHYIPVHLMPYYKQFGWKKGDLPIAESYYERCLSIPMYHSLESNKQAYVIDNVKTLLKSYSTPS